MSDVRRNFGKSRVLKKLAIAQTIVLSALFYRGTLSLQQYLGIHGGFSNEIYCKVVKCEISKMCSISD